MRGRPRSRREFLGVGLGSTLGAVASRAFRPPDQAEAQERKGKVTEVSVAPRVTGVDLRTGTLAIVSPSHGAYAEAAERLREALRRLRGTAPPVLPDGTPPDPVAGGNVIALGNLMDSAFVRRLYLAWFDWTDAAWPGPGGWTLRTLVDPHGSGGHVVLAGGSDAEGSARAVEELVRRIEDGGTLPILHEVGPGQWAAEYRKGIDPMLAPDFDWREAGGGGSGSWDFMIHVSSAGKGFLYTGETRFLELFRDQLLRFFDTHWFHRKREEPVQIHGFVHHLLIPWELTEHLPVYSDEHRERIFDAFLHLYRSTEGAARPALLSQVKRRNVRGNHDTRNALDLYFGGRYFRRAARLPEALDWLKLADDFMAPQADSSKPWEDSWGHQWTASLYNVAVYKAALGDEGYFRSRAFLEAADRAVVAHSNLQRGPLSYFAIAAVGTGNREYLHPIWMLDRRGEGRGVGERRTGGEPVPAPLRRGGGDEVGRAFWTGWEAREPTRLLGVRVAPLDRLYHETARERDGSYASVAMENVPLDRGFDKISFREGFDVRDQYLLLDGISGGGHSYQDANCIVSFDALGKVWVNAFATGGRPASVREQNGVNLVRDGRGPGREPRFAFLHDAGDFGAWGSTGSSMLDLNGAAWHRHIFWRRGSYFLVADEVEATEAGEYLVEPTWYVSGEVRTHDRSLTSSQGDDAHLTAHHDGSTWTETEAVSGGGRRRAGTTRWRQRLTATMKAGERRALATLFYATERPMPERHRLERTGRGWRVTEADGGVLFGLGRVAKGEDLLEVRAWTAAADEVLLWGCTRLSLGGLALESADPVGIRIDGGGLVLHARGETAVRLKTPSGAPRIREEETGEIAQARPDAKGTVVLPLRPGRTRVDLSSESRMERLRTLLDPGRTVPPPAVAPFRVPPKRGEDLSSCFEIALEGTAGALAFGPEDVCVGTEEGTVACLGADGRIRWSFRSEKAIRALLRRDLDGDGAPETAAGGDAETLHLLADDGRERWRRRIVWQPMQWENWSQLDCKVLSLGAGDLDGDGREEIAVGAADRHAYAFTGSGDPLWRSPVMWGPMVCCAVADVDGDGRPEVLGGAANPAIHGHCIVFRGDGRLEPSIGRPDVRSWSIPSWMVTLSAEDLDGDGRIEILTGVDTNHRQLIVYRWPNEVAWDADFGSGISALATGGPPGERRVYGGGAGGSVQAFTCKGARLWWRFLGERVVGLAAFGDRVAAATASGRITVFDDRGSIAQTLDLPSGLRTAMGHGGLFVAGREDGVVQGFRFA